jgi:phosphate starvation-inducible protein PhoH
MKESSKMIVLTDPFQSDIKNTGIHNLIDILSDIEGVGIMELGEEFQMRSPLIQAIYSKYKGFITAKN